MSSQKTLKTCAGSFFKYSGSVREGTMIYYGEGFRYTRTITRDQYGALIIHFKGQTVEAGTSRTNSPEGRVGKWLQENVTRTAISSYICPILIAERYAMRVGRTEIRFF